MTERVQKRFWFSDEEGVWALLDPEGKIHSAAVLVPSGPKGTGMPMRNEKGKPTHWGVTEEVWHAEAPGGSA